MVERIRIRERDKKDDKEFNAAKGNAEEPAASESSFVTPPENEGDEAGIGPNTAPNMLLPNEPARKHKQYTEVSSIAFTAAVMLERTIV